MRALAQERLNTSEEGLRKPWTSAISGALSTAAGAFIPIVPFFFLSGYPAVIWAAVISLIAHFAVGAAKSLLTIRSWWSSGLEMTLVGALEGVVTYLIGMVSKKPNSRRFKHSPTLGRLGPNLRPDREPRIARLQPSQ